MKRLVLKESTKNLLITLTFVAVVAGGMLLHINIVEKIITVDMVMHYEGVSK